MKIKDIPFIRIMQQDWMPGFGAYVEGTMREGEGHVLLNLGAILGAAACKDVPAKDVPYFIAETIMHEVMHALEDWAGQEFDEERIEALIMEYQRTLGQNGAKRKSAINDNEHLRDKMGQTMNDTD